MAFAPNTGFIIGTGNPGEPRNRVIAYDLFVNAAVGIDIVHIERSFISYGNPRAPLQARWDAVEQVLAGMRVAQGVQLLPRTWALRLPGELVKRGLDMMRLFLLDQTAPLEGAVAWLRHCSTSNRARQGLLILPNTGRNYIGWCGIIWRDALVNWYGEWSVGTLAQAAARITPLLQAHPVFARMCMEVTHLAVGVDDILQHHNALDVVHWPPWYKVTTTLVVPNLGGFVFMSQYPHALRGNVLEVPILCWQVTSAPLHRIPIDDRPSSAASLRIGHSENQLPLNLSVVVTLSGRCRVGIATIPPWEDAFHWVGSSSVPDAVGTMVRFRVTDGLYIQLPAYFVRDIAVVRIVEVVQAVRHAGGEVRCDPTNKGRFAIDLRQTTARLIQAVGGLVDAQGILLQRVTQPLGILSIRMHIAVNWWGLYNAVYVDVIPPNQPLAWPLAVGAGTLFTRPAVICETPIPGGNLWTGNGQWPAPGQPYRVPAAGGVQRRWKLALKLLEAASLLNLAGLLFLIFTRKLKALVFIVVAANAVGELVSRGLAFSLSQREASHYLSSMVSPVSWVVFEDGVRPQCRGRPARGILLLEAVPGFVGLVAALVGVGFQEVWSQVVIGIVAVAGFVGSWSVADFMNEACGKCECLYDPEKALVQAATLYMTALLVEVAALGPLASSDGAALTTLIFGVVEALAATYAVQRFVAASQRVRGALTTGDSVTLPAPILVMLRNLITGQGLTLAPTHKSVHCQLPPRYGSGRGVVETRQVVVGIGNNGVVEEVPISDVLGVVSEGKLSHVGSYTQDENGERRVETKVNVLHWSGIPPPAIHLSNVGSPLEMLARSAQNDPTFTTWVNRNANLERTCCQPAVPAAQALAPLQDIKAAAVALPGGAVLLPYGYGADKSCGRG